MKKYSKYLLITYKDGDTREFLNFSTLEEVNQYEVKEGINHTKLFKLSMNGENRILIEENRF